MIKRDKYNILVDSTGDGGDSANRSGLARLCGSLEELHEFEVDGLCMRHPFQKPWDNFRNFSRDQLLPLIAGFHEDDELEGYLASKRIFWSHVRRLLFCQNFQRDIPGSWKYPWPNTFINDKGESEKVLFDFADPLLPDHIWHLILCARIYWLYGFGIIGIPWLCGALYLHCRFDKSNDEGQIISQCIIAGPWFVKKYKQWKPDWKDSLNQYWNIRRQIPEMSDLISKKLDAY